MTLGVRDDRNRELFFVRPPRRVVSLVPSDTLTLFELGAGGRVVGRTRYCVEPSDRVAAIPVVGGTKDVDEEAVIALAPDLVVCNQEENARPQLERMARAGLPLFVSFPRRVADGIAHAARLARLLAIEREPKVSELMVRAYNVLREAEARRGSTPSLAVFLPIWIDPLMTVSGETFASDMLALAGGRNVFADRERRYPLAADLGRREPLPADKVGDRDVRYPRVTQEEVEARAPELILLPDEPYAFTAVEAALFARQDTPAARRGAVVFCDGKDLFWYGTRTVSALPRLSRLIAAQR